LTIISAQVVLGSFLWVNKEGSLAIDARTTRIEPSFLTASGRNRTTQETTDLLASAGHTVRGDVARDDVQARRG
jgi:hypothetical protein